MAERKMQFMHYLSTSGVYHSFKERLKPKIQRVARARYGARGQALGRTSSRGLSATMVPAAEVHPSAEERGLGLGLAGERERESNSSPTLTKQVLLLLSPPPPRSSDIYYSSAIYYLDDFAFLSTYYQYTITPHPLTSSLPPLFLCPTAI